MRFGFFRFARCRNVQSSCSNWGLLFNMQFDQRVLTGFRGFPSMVTQGCELHQEGFLLGQTSGSTIPPLLRLSGCADDGEGSEMATMAEVLEAFLVRKGYSGIQHKNIGMILCGNFRTSSSNSIGT
eukprot:GEMP01083407.1.p1 GENE.GEMP01083407.1~~GEMP01083407.1.p1  ORF type:complete len:126 (+),score=16.40 GEMP01083407.1:143-520(+)